MSVRFDWKPKVGKDGKIQFNTADGVPVRKHGEGDQKPHGNWASKMGRRVGYTLGVGDWESTKPWTWSKEQFENTPGWELYDSDRPVLASDRKSVV